uniref:Kallikrein-1 n=1 Tax=Lygus hesperus TaxID=30085 RepID=A0A0A9YUL6_LYGHE
MSSRLSIIFLAVMLLGNCRIGTSKSMVAVMRIEENGYIFRCSGVLIADNAVLTACSCVSVVVTDIETTKSKLTPFHAKDIMVLLGKTLKVEKGESSRVSFLNLHPKCNNDYDYDLAVLHTFEHLAGAQGLIAKLPSEGAIEGKLSSSGCVTSGWGISQNVDQTLPDVSTVSPLDHIKVKFDKTEECNTLVCVLDVNAVCDPDLSGFKCLKSTDGTPICSTDSGAPVLCDNVLVGITSLQRVIDSNCDDENLSRRSLVVPLTGSVDFITSSLSASKPTTQKIQWGPAPGEAPLVGQTPAGKTDKPAKGRSIGEEDDPQSDPGHESAERKSSSSRLNTSKFSLSLSTS